MVEQRGEHPLAPDLKAEHRIAAAHPGQAEVAALGGDGVVGGDPAVVEQVVGPDVLAHIGDAAMLLDRLGTDLAGTGGQVHLAGQLVAGLLQRLGGDHEAAHRAAIIGDRVAVELAVLQPALFPFGIGQGLGRVLVGVQVRVPGRRLGVQVGGEQQVLAHPLAAVRADDVGPLRRRPDLARREALARHPVVDVVGDLQLLARRRGNVAQGQGQFDDLVLADRGGDGGAVLVGDLV
jgi:hypothetical protein